MGNRVHESWCRSLGWKSSLLRVSCQSSFSRSAFLSDYLTDSKLHRKKISSKIAPSGIWTHNLWIITLMLCQLSWVTIWRLSVWIIKAFIMSCSIDSRNEQSPTYEVVHETNKAHFRNFLPNRFLPSSVGRVLEWWSGGHGFKAHRGQFLMTFIFFCVTWDLSDNLTKMRQISLSWKTRVTRQEQRETVALLHQVLQFSFLCAYTWCTTAQSIKLTNFAMFMLLNELEISCIEM